MLVQYSARGTMGMHRGQMVNQLVVSVPWFTQFVSTRANRCGREIVVSAGRGDADLGTEISTETFFVASSKSRKGRAASVFSAAFRISTHCNCRKSCARGSGLALNSNGDSRKPPTSRPQYYMLRTRDSGREEGAPMALYTVEHVTRTIERPQIPISSDGHSDHQQAWWPIVSRKTACCST